jgi:large subunit ribosomal protein L11
LKIAKIKLPDANTNSLKSMVKMVLGTAVSMGVTVEGKDPREVIKEVDEGKWDHVLEG